MSTTASAKRETVLVTGATDGLGRATAILFASEGYRVFAAGRDAQKRAALEQLAEEQHMHLETLELDVTSDESADRAIAEIQRRTGPVDILVNNAGIGIASVMEEVTLADLRKQFETNFFGVVRMTQRVLPAMRERRHGCIVNMSSIAGVISNPLMGPYSGSKHALEAISDALRLELASFGIRVILIEPGFIPTNINRAGAELSSRYIGNAAASPYARVYLGFLKSWQKGVARAKSTPEDCAHVILRAVRNPRPHARYTVTREARIGKWMRWIFSDRTFDRAVLKMMGLDRPSAEPPSQEAIQVQIDSMMRARPR
ncbi:MAG TPA: SDR family oxidoreductase [Candidatus Acidoferrales bacterium]|nr:SDR family oxidoreductase [Candidatus Acidoferrales bacterium]